MKKIFPLLLLCTSFIFSQYQPKCEYIVNPDYMIGHVDSCAKFWLPTYDWEHGGFYENVGRDGTIDGTSKTMLGQSRTAYGMARAFMMTGDTTYLRYAEDAMNFMYQYAWDNTNNGWFNEFNRDGSLRSNGDHNDDKWSFMQHYALLGIAAMYDATRSDLHKNWLIKGRNIVDEKLFDERPDYIGYYDNSNLDWGNPNGKGFTPTMDGITTHVLATELLELEGVENGKLEILADNVIDYMWPAMSHFQYGYPESYTSDWEPVTSSTFVFTGHFLKSAWCATRAYLLNPKQDYVDFSTVILDEVLNKGYDNTYGGNYSNYNGQTGNPFGNDKEWWQLEQGFTSSFMNFYITGDEKYLEMADETLKFYMDNFVDRTYGEVYMSTSRDGSSFNGTKASYWKAGYHSIELGYYVYTYVSLYNKNQPVELYYYIEPADTSRSIRLTPIVIEDEKLLIKSVQLEGSEYTDFNGSARSLNVAANTGGIFKVTFARDEVSSVAQTSLPKSFVLHQNYPNPFNPSTNLKFELSEPGFVKAEVRSITGEVIKSVVAKEYSAGTHTLRWNGDNNFGQKVSNGIYFIIFTNNSHRYINKAILMK